MMLLFFEKFDMHLIIFEIQVLLTGKNKNVVFLFLQSYLGVVKQIKFDLHHSLILFFSFAHFVHVHHNKNFSF
jgi:hypothetical protein